jgi:2-dehydropantoate 2-reductase
MRYVIMGTGGVGGFFGAKLAEAGEDVWFVARGKHFDAMKEHGLKVTSTVGTFTIPTEKVTSDPTSIGNADVVLFCVKAYDTEAAARQIAPLLHEQSIVLSLQNGVDNAEKIRRQLSRGLAYAGAAYISVRITAPGEITESGGFQRIVFGPTSGPTVSRARDIHAAFLRAGIKCDLHDNIEKELWRKFIFIASMGALTALSRLTHGEILSNPRSLALMFDAMREIQAIAIKLGIDVEPVDETKVLEGLKRFDPDTRSSMYFDLASGRPMEIEALNGTVVRFGEKLGMPTPIHRVIYATLLPHHLKHVQQRTST